jgi:hypothetical protein
MQRQVGERANSTRNWGWLADGAAGQRRSLRSGMQAAWTTTLHLDSHALRDIFSRRDAS